MVSTITVRPDGITELADVLTQSVDAMGDCLEALNAQVNLLMNSWSGDAQSAYGRVQSQWMRDIAELKVILLQIELVTDSIKLKYVQADNRIAREFNF